MTVNSDRLGGNLPLLKPEALSTQQKELYDRIIATLDAFGESAHFEVETEDGRLIGPFNPMLYSPAISSRLLELMDTEGNDTSLSSRVREVTILVGAVCGFDTGLAFTTRHGTPIEPRNFNRSFSRRIGKAAVPEITVHGARKTCGSMLATP